MEGATNIRVQLYSNPSTVSRLHFHVPTRDSPQRRLRAATVYRMISGCPSALGRAAHIL